MHDEAAFLSAIRETPADDTARLVFADWLDEQDDPLCKTKAAFIRLELQMAEAPEQNLNRARTLEELETLATQLDPNWLVVVSHPKLEACRMQFQFECPKQWARLMPTDDPKVRFCNTCKKNVHYCDTLQEAQNHAANGNCVALTVARPALVSCDRHQPASPMDPRVRSTYRDAIEDDSQFRVRASRPIDSFDTRHGRTPHGSRKAAPAQSFPNRLTGSTAGTGAARGRAGERPKWKQKRRKNRKRNRNTQRENWEDAE